jgi:hypothetical protein
MEGLFKILPRHNSDHSPLTRHASVYLVEYDSPGKRLRWTPRRSGGVEGGADE